jgi:hypothetical protein
MDQDTSGSKDSKDSKDNMIIVTCNDRLGKKVQVKCALVFLINKFFLFIFSFIFYYSPFLLLTRTKIKSPTDSILEFKKLLAAHIGTPYNKIKLRYG